MKVRRAATARRLTSATSAIAVSANEPGSGIDRPMTGLVGGRDLHHAGPDQVDRQQRVGRKRNVGAHEREIGVRIEQAHRERSGGSVPGTPP